MPPLELAYSEGATINSFYASTDKQEHLFSISGNGEPAKVMPISEALSELGEVLSAQHESIGFNALKNYVKSMRAQVVPGRRETDTSYRWFSPTPTFTCLSVPEITSQIGEGSTRVFDRDVENGDFVQVVLHIMTNTCLEEEVTGNPDPRLKFIEQLVKEG